MQARCPYPAASILVMALVLAVICVLLAAAGALRPIGGAVLIMFVIAAAVGIVVWAISYALQRSGTHRLSRVQTWR